MLSVQQILIPFFARSSLYVFRYADTNIYTPASVTCCSLPRWWLLGVLALYGVLQYLTAFLGAGILYVVLRPWFTAWCTARHWNRTFVTVLLLLFAVVVLVIPFFALTSLLHRPCAVLSAEHRPDSGYACRIFSVSWGCR
ncbi:MAG: hypothetical protein WKG07_10380 [Hymenobacter sp.]